MAALGVNQFMVPAITSSTAAPSPDRIPVQKLGQDEFIKILVTQLTTQDPLNPQKDTEFIGQMAQFSALESGKAMQTEIQTLRAHQLLGQTVQVQNGEESTLVGTVTAVDNQNGQPRIIIGDTAYTLADVVRVERGNSNN
jgi:flagellar basal-body rod modification protein FlgD